VYGIASDRDAFVGGSVDRPADPDADAAATPVRMPWTGPRALFEPHTPALRATSGAFAPTAQ